MTKTDRYSSHFTQRYLIGPNSMLLPEEMTAPYAAHFKNARVLDLGC